VVPRLSLDLWHDLHVFTWGLTVGHDLVGASGFTAALWADYLSITASYHFAKNWRLFAIGNLFRNGPAPDKGYNFTFTLVPGVSQGYALETGLEWEWARNWALQATYYRIVQVGAAGDLGLIRMVVTAL
jgi:hypothetical protein